MSLDKLIDCYNAKLESLKSEVRELSCDLSPHPADVELCQKLKIKLDLYQDFLKDLKKLREN
jgi:hypothetical protein